MTQFLPPNLLALFAPRDPVPYLPPADKLTHEKKRVPYLGIAQFTSLFEVLLFSCVSERVSAHFPRQAESRCWASAKRARPDVLGVIW